MNRKGWILVGVTALLVVTVPSAGIWYLFIDTPAITGSDLNATTPDPAVSTAPPQFAMTVEVENRPLENGSERTSWSAGVLYDADANERLGWRHSTGPANTVSTAWSQRHWPDGTHNVIRYHNTDNEAFTRRVGSIRTDLDDETETLRVDNGSQTYRYYRAGERSEFDVVDRPMPPLAFVHVVPYKYDGTTTVDGAEVERYVPVEGWVERPGSVADDGADTYISNTSGAVYVSRETGTIVHADVSFTSKRTDIRAGRWFGDDGTRVHYTLSVRETVDPDEVRPEWVAEVLSEET